MTEDIASYFFRNLTATPLSYVSRLGRHQLWAYVVGHAPQECSHCSKLRQILNELQTLPSTCALCVKRWSSAKAARVTAACCGLGVSRRNPTTHQATFTMNRSSQRSYTLSQVPLGPAPTRPYRIICEGNQRGVSAAETCVGHILVTVVHDVHASNSASMSTLMKSVVMKSVVLWWVLSVTGPVA